MIDFLVVVVGVVGVFVLGLVIGVVWADKDNERLYSVNDYETNPYDNDYL